MPYVALIPSDEGAWAALPDAERRDAYARYATVADEMRSAGVLLGGDELASSQAATTVRVRGGDTLVTDGPYAEVKEALGGYFLLECGSLDEALGWAAKIPGAAYGAVEVRPVHVEREEAS